MQSIRHRHPRACHTDDMRDPHDKLDKHGRLKRIGRCYQAELSDVEPPFDDTGANNREEERVLVIDGLADVSRQMRSRALLPDIGADAWSDDAPLRETKQQCGSKKQQCETAELQARYEPTCISPETAAGLWSRR